jgi:hypothetical protein
LHAKRILKLPQPKLILNESANAGPSADKRRSGPRLARLAVWAGIAAIVTLSLVPGYLRPHTGFPGKAEHFAAYACTGFALSFAYIKFRERVAAWAALGAASLILELLQRWIPGRSPDMRDALASTTGLTGGLVLGALLAALAWSAGRSRVSSGGGRPMKN